MSLLWILLERWWRQLECKATVKMSPPTNQHPAFYKPDAPLVTQQTVTEGKQTATMANENRKWKTDVAEGNVGMGVAGAQQSQIQRSIHQLQRRRYLTVGKAVQRQVSLSMNISHTHTNTLHTIM